MKKSVNLLIGAWGVRVPLMHLLAGIKREDIRYGYTWKGHSALILVNKIYRLKFPPFVLYGSAIKMFGMLKVITRNVIIFVADHLSTSLF